MLNCRAKSAVGRAKKPPPKPKIRCSSLPRILACPASMIAPKITINHDSPQAALGRAVHEVLASYVSSPDPYLPEIEPFGAKYQIPFTDMDDFRFLAHAGKRAWDELRKGISGPGVPEAELRADFPDFTLTGHPDVFGREETTNALLVVDWKTGRYEADASAQIMGYLCLLEASGHQAPAYKGITVWLRSGEAQVGAYASRDLEAMREKISLAIRAGAGENPIFRPGPDACAFCPRAMECPARAAWLRDAVAALEVSGTSEVFPGLLAGLYHRARALRAALDHYDDALKAEVERAGTLALLDGSALVLEDRARATFNATMVIEAVKSGLKLTRAAEAGFAEKALRIDKAGLDRWLIDLVPSGKGAFRDEFLAKLEAAGALTKVPYRVLVNKKSTTQPPEIPARSEA